MWQNCWKGSEMDSTSRAVWTDTTIGDVIDIFDSKRIPLNGSERKQRQGQYPYYGASGVIDYIDDYIFNGRYLLIAEDGENLNSRKLPVAFFAKGKFWVNNHAHIVRAKVDVADDHFLFSWFAQANISGYITGAAQPKLSQENLKRIELSLPTLPTQRKIAAILSAYDNLIENNQRRIKILEEMVQNLYREWFIKFRFPGYQNARFVDSQLGRIPEGWKVVKLGKLLEIRKGKNITKKTIVEGSVPVVAGGMTPAYYHNAPNTRQPVITISASGANAGFVCLYHEDVWASDCSVIDSDTTPHVYYFYLYLKHRHTEVTRLQRGAAQPHVYPKDLMDINANDVPMELLERFNQEVTAVFQMIRNLTLKNTILRRTRDLLLPRLISGEVDVSELDITIPEEATA
jgi:type I restriction enzyme S subunit